MSLLLFTALIFVAFFAFQTYQELERAKHNLRRYEYLSSQESFQETLDTDIQRKQKENTRLESMHEEIAASIAKLKPILEELQEEEYVQSFGFYQPKYDFISAGSYASELKRIKVLQRKMISTNKAAVCHTPWSVNESKKEGERMIKNFLKLVLKIFNSECGTNISELKYSSNVEITEAKIEKLFHNLNKNSKVIHCEINQKYLSLKLKELHLQYQLKCEQQEEREQENAIREEAKERKKIDRAMKEAEEAAEKENQIQLEIENAQLELENALQEQTLGYGIERDKLKLKIQQLNQDLERATSDKDKANAKAAMTKSGYIYVISNIGSFGRDVYRICMTKKSGNPDDYIKQMTPVVPFPFDIHLRFVSEDALDTFSRLKTAFDDRRVNKLNERREFFSTSLEEIILAVENIKEETGVIKSLYLEKVPQAMEHRRTQAIMKKNSQVPSEDRPNLNGETA